MAEGIFSEIRVLDFTNVLSGPTLTRLMAEMGADVIKVEMPPIGDMSRVLPWLIDGRSGYFVQQNRGKRSLFVDVKRPEGRDLLRELIPLVDVLVENFSPGVIDRLGFGWDVVSKLNPRLVMCSISAFGQQGPLADQPGYDGIAQAYAGVLHMNGRPDEAPVLMGLSPGDVLTGVHGFGAVSAALYHRERSGLGQKVEVALLDCYATCQELNVEAWSLSGGEFEPVRSGSLHGVVPGYGVFAVGSEYILLAATNDRQWAQLCEAMGRPELASAPSFADIPARVAHRDEVNQLIIDWLATQPDRDAAIAVLAAQRVPVAPVLSVSEAVTHPHAQAQRTFRRVPDEVLGSVDIPGMPLRFSEFPDELDLRAVSLGAHNHDVVCGLLGAADARYDALVAAGVLLAEPCS